MSTAIKETIQIDYNELEPCVFKVDFTIPKDTVSAEYKEVVREFASMAQVPGFRKGKAPAMLIRNRFNKEISSEVTKKIYMQSYEKLMDDKEIEILTYPDMDQKADTIKPEEDFAFAMEFNVAPKFELPDYKGLKVERPKVDIDDAAINEQIDYYRNVYAAYESVDSPAEAGDMLKVSYTSDYELPEDAELSLKRQVESDENWLWLQDPESIPGSIEALTGAEKDKEYELQAVYADDYRESDLAGKTVNYKIKVAEVQKKVPITDDQELAQKMNLESIDQLKEQLRSRQEGEARMAAERELRDSLLNQLLDQIPEFPFPPKILEGEKMKELRNIASREVKTEEDAEKFKENQATYEEEALKNAKNHLRRFLVLRKIAEIEDINVDNNEVSSQLKGMSSMYGMKEKDLIKAMNQSGRMEDLHLEMLMGKVTDFILSEADIKGEEKPAATKDQAADSDADTEASDAAEDASTEEEAEATAKSE